MRYLTGALGLFAAGACLAWAPPVAAENAALGLRYSAPPTCPSGAAAERATLALVGALRAPFLAEMTVRQDGAAWVGRLETDGAVRELRAPTCREAVQALIVVLALSIDPTVRVRDEAFADLESPAKVTSDDTAESSASSRTEQRLESPRRAIDNPAARETHPSRRDARTGAAMWGASARLLGNVGLLPAPTIGAAVGAHYGSASGFAELAALAVLPRSMAWPEQGGRGGTFEWQGARVLAGVELPVVPRCQAIAGFEVGRLAGRGYGVDHWVTGQALWLGVLAGVRVRPLATRSFALETGVAASIPLLRPSFGFADTETVHRPASVGGWAEIGIRWH